MIEISARLYRGSVYFTNETLRCLITFRNVSDGGHSPPEVLAWSGVQIHCQCTVDETRVVAARSSVAREQQTALSSTETSFQPFKGERGKVVFSTKPKILFCDLNLMPNESKSYLYQETIPSKAPPSYTGSAVKYVYKLSIGTQRINNSIQLLQMPLRVLAISQQNDVSPDEELEDVSPVMVTNSDHFLHTDLKENTLDLLLHKLDCLTARRSPSSFVITNQLGKVVNFSIFKTAFKLGEDVIGIFNFEEATVPCVQYSVTLQSEEVVKEECRNKSAKSTKQITSYSKIHEFCLDTSTTHIILPIPLTVTPTFETNILSLTWKLHFEFVTTKPEEIKCTQIRDSQGCLEQSPTNLTVQTMVWDLPITVYPTHPIQVGRGLQMPASGTLVV
ncbi:RAB6A-GEF complex partner protein 2-like protein [Dinothrombium tinctorium]|uniref:RAB6A-GEF complex partner protein 2-like protein n=1 Tax=Dinothrombium tinctorium TaxID=1965070 RepID=A0A443R323_9ACAR|nr:RAB6A-GEF complex partner protein 2-like protein [Dinothrombium tinctorium]